jgi:hypothetical protein
MDLYPNRWDLVNQIEASTGVDTIWQNSNINQIAIQIENTQT